jgi:hypothetical protein
MSTHRIGMEFDKNTRLWKVTRCYQGKGPVPMVRRYADGSRELLLSSDRPVVVGAFVSPRWVLTAWQNRPRRLRALAESPAARRH